MSGIHPPLVMQYGYVVGIASMHLEMPSVQGACCLLQCSNGRTVHVPPSLSHLPVDKLAHPLPLLSVLLA